MEQTNSHQRQALQRNQKEAKSTKNPAAKTTFWQPSNQIAKAKNRRKNLQYIAGKKLHDYYYTTIGNHVIRFLTVLLSSSDIQIIW